MRAALESKRLAHRGAVIANAEAQVLKFAEQLNLPVTNTLMGLGIFPGTHPQNVGMLGMHGTFEANKTMHNSDLIICLGARFDDRVTNAIDKTSEATLSVLI